MTATRLILSSRRTDGGDAAVAAILRVSRANNARDGITSALIVGERDYAQLVEGDGDKVSACFDRIRRDDRHADVAVLSHGPIRERLFAGTSMAAIDAAALGRGPLRGYLPEGRFEPRRLSPEAITDIFRVLSRQEWDEAALRAPDAGSQLLHTLAVLRRIQTAAHQVLGDAGRRELDHATLLRLRDSLDRQAEQVRRLRQELATDAFSSPELRDEVHREAADLQTRFEALSKNITGRAIRSRN